jgi:tripartite-type tricarboxylate transporter receptor subunit TctC
MLKAFLSAIALAGALTAVSQPAFAQSDYPNRVVKVVVPYGPGSAPDILARALTTSLSGRLGQQFIVENRTGGSGAIGTASVARAEPDGYTLLFAPALVLSVLPQARGGAEAGYKPDSFAPVCQTFVNTMGLAVRPDSPLKSVADLIAEAKRRPGQLNYGHPGLLTIPHLAMEELQQTAGVDTKDIPFRTGPQSIAELLGGRLDFISQVMGTEVGQNIRIIAVFSDKRIATFPDVPTAREQGYDVSPVSFGGLLAPLSTPEPVLAKLGTACRDAAKDEVYVTIAKRAGQPDDLYLDAAGFKQRLQGDVASKARVLARLKTQP